MATAVLSARRPARHVHAAVDALRARADRGARAPLRRRLTARIGEAWRVPALDQVLPTLRCPHCGAGLERDGDVVRCEAGHAFDVARQGYLNLIAGSPHTGDTAEMIAARERILAAGHFEPLAEAIAETLAERAEAGGERAQAGSERAEPAGARSLGAPLLVVELGAGTGWYLARVLDRLPGALGLALDVSKPALRRAARAHPRLAAVGADVWGSLPLRDGVATAVLNVFAPRDQDEIARVLSPGGCAVVVSARPGHLQELREPLGLLDVGDKQRSGRELTWTLRVDRAAVRDLAAMGPSAFHVSPAELDERVQALAETTTVTMAVSLATAAPGYGLA